MDNVVGKFVRVACFGSPMVCLSLSKGMDGGGEGQQRLPLPEVAGEVAGEFFPIIFRDYCGKRGIYHDGEAAATDETTMRAALRSAVKPMQPKAE